MGKEHIIDEIRRTAEENAGIPLGLGKFERQTGIKRDDWSGKYWTKWSDAVREAGYEPNIFNAAFSEEWLLNSVVNYIHDKKKFPTKAELKIRSFSDKSFPNSTTLRNRLGNKNEMAKKIVEYCKNNNEFPDVINICLPIIESVSQTKADEAFNDIEYGFVYLIQSGKYYKIGRSNSADRRAYELKIQLPGKIKLVHQIKTDDPVGIEIYWHNRFNATRKGGEWFELSSRDINAFKRRKFM